MASGFTKVGNFAVKILVRTWWGPSIHPSIRSLVSTPLQTSSVRCIYRKIFFFLIFFSRNWHWVLGIKSFISSLVLVLGPRMIFHRVYGGYNPDHLLVLYPVPIPNRFCW
jgi:hypothetical protein